MQVFLSLPVSVAIVRWGDRKIVEVNAAFSRLTGFSSEEASGRTMGDLGLVREDASAVLRAELAEKERLQNAEVTLRVRHGEERHVLLASEFVELHGERHAVSTFVDITERKRAEAALEEHSRYLGLALDAAQMGVWKLDLATGKASTIQGAGPISGQGEIASLEAFQAMLHPEDRAAETERLQRAWEVSDRSQSEFRIVRQDGEVRWVAQSSRCVRDASGRPVAIYGVDLDITDRKASEFISNRLAAIVESSDDAIISKDLDGIIQTWNRGAERIFGYTAEEMVGTSILRLIPEERHPEEAQIISKLRQGQPIEHFETKRRTKDGRLIHVAVTASPMRDATGKIVGASKIARDITESRRTRAALRRSEEQFQMMLDALPQLAWIADADGAIFWYNQRWYDYTGTTAEEMMGWGWQRVHDSTILPAVVERWTAAIAAAEPFDMEFPLRSASGEFRWFLTRSVPLRDADGTVQRWIGTNTDISEKRDAEEEIHELNATLEQRVLDRTAQLEAANKELEAFSYSVSHDLRAPLRAVDGFSQAVVEDYAALLPAEGQRYLQTIREGAQRMGALIDDLLAFSRLGRAAVVRREIDVESQVREIFDEQKAQYEGREIELINGHLPPCSGDATLLRQVWVNLLSNALKYTSKRERAVIEIGARAEKGETVYFVRDNGTGFDMRYAHKLFGVFQRLHRQEDFSGTGVGLAIVQRIIHRHGGRIWVEAEVDLGATFFFTLGGETTP